jgi:TolA-binding protein
LNRGSTLRQGQALRVSVPESTAIVYRADELPPQGARASAVKAKEGVEEASPVAGDGQAAGPGPEHVIVDPSTRTTAGSLKPSPVRTEGGDGWKKLAEEGRYEEAVQAAEAVGFPALCGKLGPADLLRLAEVARFAGRPARAEQALVALRKRYARGRHAAIAAYTLGRTAFDQQAEYGKAARWFEVYIEEQPAGPLAREALGRLMEARQRAGLKEQARSAAREYLQRYPRGPHADIASRLTAE